jgi:hypothetical protein
MNLMRVEDEGWIEWSGGECPVARGTLIEVRFRSGAQHIGTGWRWAHDQGESSIVAYRLASPSPLRVERGADVIELKTWSEYFADVASGVKPFELRRHDRNVAVGSVLRLREWSPTAEAYTGRDCLRRVTYVLQNAPQFGLEDGFAIYGLAEANDNPWFELLEDIECAALELHMTVAGRINRVVELARKRHALAQPTKPEHASVEVVEALSELADLMDAVRSGDYKPDSFTTQPARLALAALQAKPSGGEG